MRKAKVIRPIKFIASISKLKLYEPIVPTKKSITFRVSRAASKN